MNVYTNNNFKGHWPVPTACVVVATNRFQAAELLSVQLRVLGLEQTVNPDDFELVDTETVWVHMLSDGDY